MCQEAQDPARDQLQRDRRTCLLRAPKYCIPKTIRPVVGCRHRPADLQHVQPSPPWHTPDSQWACRRQPGKVSMGEQVVKAVTAIRKQRLVTIEGRGMLGVPGVAARRIRGGRIHWHKRPAHHAGLIGTVHLFCCAV
ncbi:MAG: hypothetical protein MZU91_02230 [Desulfosudis oleivorans]|nr:hypothetical protein [Desulfosudis oleivorans]